MASTPRPVRPAHLADEDLAGAPASPWRNLGLAALIAALLVPLLFAAPFRLVEARLFDVFSTIAPLTPPQPSVTIVAIDEPSFAEIGQRWPWPRSLHGTVVEKLRAAGAKVVGVDIIFSEPSTPQADAALAAAMGPDVVLAADDVTTVMEQGTQVSRVGPIDDLTEAGAVPGVTSVDLDGDASLRRMPSVPDSFAAQALHRAGLPVTEAPEGALIQYFGGPRTYPTVSYYQALDPDGFLPKGFFKDRIVFVGLSLKAAPTPDSGAADTFPTPYTLADNTVTAGVEIQATILDNLRHGLFITPVARPAMAGLVIAAAFLAMLLCGTGMSWRAVIRAVLALAGLILGSWLLLRYGRLWAPPALPAAAMLGVFGTRFGLDYMQERHLRRTVSTAFSRYLPPDLVKQLARNPSALKLGGERRTLSILFCDVRGFTSLSERLKDEPEKLTTLINRLLDPLSEAVMAEGGTIDKYMGDCVMAFWNAPLPAHDHPHRAVQAALRMIEAVKDLNAVLKGESGESAPVFAVGVGVNTGDCVVGNVGSRWRYDYSVLGDTVNLASRLEGLSKEYGVSVILGPSTAEAVRDDYVLVELDRIAVRGRTTQSAIYTVLTPASGRADAAVAEAEALHARLTGHVQAGETAEALALIPRCEALAPALSKYYARLREKLSAP
ncbi:CHASE2 domain-containing protein [Microvirga pudoricolor]|uniref:CHASE2 domain-containing protein n=1 Tax=Microvirga pudoricolor TaxID=2778729 RepID=UPI00194DBE16|nr:adenylate/guanylate cyclase domain-containing protein [Microvirga pudoricolor]MBM6593705.1 adenylate/guanylate cyclase domain-containing protein [Microvirga pudoricolor]